MLSAQVLSFIMMIGGLGPLRCVYLRFRFLSPSLRQRYSDLVYCDDLEVKPDANESQCESNSAFVHPH